MGQQKSVQISTGTANVTYATVPVRQGVSDSENVYSEACKYHSDGLVEGDITVQTCWDSDRLELGRVGIKPSPQRLCTEFAKRKDVIAAAYKRSINNE